MTRPKTKNETPLQYSNATLPPPPNKVLGPRKSPQPQPPLREHTQLTDGIWISKIANMSLETIAYIVTTASTLLCIS